ncbi:MAG TPA: DNA recombination protein RmuC [Candidatus Limiplasma sp.]|nr:DNA recombination protein RmuC [Candidatus Limiplasma sp.]
MFPLEPWQWLATGLLTLLVILMIAALALLRRRQNGDALVQNLRMLQSAISEDSLRQREELMRTLHAINESLLGNLNRNAEYQVNQFSAQEGRQARMYSFTEESLNKFETRMASIDKTLEQELTKNEARIKEMREMIEKSITGMRADNEKKLDEMRKTVDEKLQDTLNKRLTQSFTQVSDRLEQVYKSLGEVHRLAEGVGDLRRVLGNVKRRGVWGEIQLGNLLAEVLTEKQYETNVQLRPGAAERVEFAVCLPGKEDDHPVYLPIDSKFPQEDYARLADASEQGDALATEAARTALINAVKLEAKRIATKYIEPPYTTDFAVMFLPLESLYAEVMRNASLVETVQREQRIVIAGPSTLLAMLNSLQMGFRTLAIEKRSAEVWRLLGAVKNDFGLFSQVLQNTQEKLSQASKTIDKAFVRTRSIERKLRGVEELDEGESKKLLGDIYEDADTERTSEDDTDA